MTRVGTHVVEMTHQDVRVRLMDFLDGHLAEEQQRQVRGHLELCIGCRAYYATLRQTIDIAGSLPRPKAPARVRRRLVDALRASAIQPPPRSD